VLFDEYQLVQRFRCLPGNGDSVGLLAGKPGFSVVGVEDAFPFGNAGGVGAGVDKLLGVEAAQHVDGVACAHERRELVHATNVKPRATPGPSNNVHYRRQHQNTQATRGANNGKSGRNRADPVKTAKIPPLAGERGGRDVDKR